MIFLRDILLFKMDTASKLMKRNLQEAFFQEGIDITVDEWMLMKVLAETIEATQQQLSKLTARNPSSVSRILDLLAKKKFVERSKSERDRRVYVPVLTDRGRAYLNNHMSTILELEEMITGSFSTQKKEKMAMLLDQLLSEMIDKKDTY
jgi:DNA-binding MarR family transcriptional regulator